MLDKEKLAAALIAVSHHQISNSVKEILSRAEKVLAEDPKAFSSFGISEVKNEK